MVLFEGNLSVQAHTGLHEFSNSQPFVRPMCTVDLKREWMESGIGFLFFPNKINQIMCLSPKRCFHDWSHLISSHLSAPYCCQDLIFVQEFPSKNDSNTCLILISLLGYVYSHTESYRFLKHTHATWLSSYAGAPDGRTVDQQSFTERSFLFFFVFFAFVHTHKHLSSAASPGVALICVYRCVWSIAHHWVEHATLLLSHELTGFSAAPCLTQYVCNRTDVNNGGADCTETLNYSLLKQHV